MDSEAAYIDLAHVNLMILLSSVPAYQIALEDDKTDDYTPNKGCKAKGNIIPKKW